MEPKHKKQLIVTAAVVAGLYFFPAIMNTARHTLIVRNEAYRQMEKPSPAKPLAPISALVTTPGATVISPASTDTPADPKYAALLGKYMGGAILKTRECKANFELKLNQDKPAEFSGFVTIVCYRPFTQKGATPLISDPVAALGTMATPASAILSGPAVNGSIRMKADKADGKRIRALRPCLTAAPLPACPWCPLPPIKLRSIGKKERAPAASSSCNTNKRRQP